MLVGLLTLLRKVGYADRQWSTHFASQNCYAAAVFFGGEVMAVRG
ncbi:MAG: hypothetical protein R3Y53_04215 [Bacillota bacterium]